MTTKTLALAALETARAYIASLPDDVPVETPTGGGGSTVASGTPAIKITSPTGMQTFVAGKQIPLTGTMSGGIVRARIYDKQGHILHDNVMPDANGKWSAVADTTPMGLDGNSWITASGYDSTSYTKIIIEDAIGANVVASLPDAGASGNAGTGGGTGGTTAPSTGSNTTAPTSPGLTVSTPAANTPVSGKVSVSGTCGSDVVNVGAFDAEWKKIAPDVAPANGAFTLSVDTTLMTNGANTINVVGFTVAAGVQGGTSYPAAVPVTVSDGKAPPKPVTNGLTLIFEDDFANGIDQTKWFCGGKPTSQYPVEGEQYGDAHLVNQTETAYFDQVYVKVADGLSLRAIKVDNYNDPQGWGRNHVGSQINLAMPDSSAPYAVRKGYYEVVAKLPAGPGEGAWPGIWLMETGCINKATDPGSIEADIEAYGWPTIINLTLHDWQKDGKDHIGGTTAYTLSSGDFSTDFHTFGHLFTDTDWAIFIDGKEVHRQALPTGRTISPLYLMVDMNLGGGWPIKHDTYEMVVKSVKVYRAD